MTMEDLASYRAVEREPVSGTYRGYTIVSMPPPSSGGAHIIEILNILEGYPLREQGLNSAASLHEMAEAEKLAYADRAAWLGDPDFVKIPLAGLLSKAYAEHLRSLISPTAPAPPPTSGPASLSDTRATRRRTSRSWMARQRGRQHLYAELALWVRPGRRWDRNSLNNELDDFAAKPGAANAFGFMGGDANAPGPKRPLSSMSPTLVFKDGKLLMATGSPGGSTSSRPSCRSSST